MKQRVYVGLVLGIGLVMAISAVAVSGVALASEQAGRAGGVAAAGDSFTDGCSTAPTPLAPENGAALNTRAPVLRWDAGNDPQATRVHIELSTDRTFSQPEHSMLHWSGQGTGEWDVGMNLEECTTYSWRAALKCGDVLGPWSDVWSFDTGCGCTLPGATTPLEPPQGTAASSLPVTFRWTRAPGATTYRVCWREVGTWNTYCSSWMSETEYSAFWGIEAGKTYEWWVTARNECGLGPESAKSGFTTAPDLTTPTLRPTCTKPPEATCTPTLTTTPTMIPTSTGTLYPIYLPVIRRSWTNPG